MRCSVVIPAYNAADTILATLDSVLANLEDNDEVLIIDDGSEDQTVQVCTGADTRVRVISISNGGPANARNTGIDAASGELVAFCDADDIWHENKLQLQRQCFVDTPELGLCFTDYQVVDSDNKVLTPSAVADRDLPTTHTLASMLKANPVMTSSAVARRSVLKEIGSFPNTYNDELKVHLAVEDFEAWVAIAERYPIAMVAQVLASYRISTGGIFMRSTGTRRGIEVLLNRRIALIKRIAQRNPDQVSSAQAKAAIAETYFRYAYQERLSAYFLNSAKMNILSLLHQPSRPKAYITLMLLPVRAAIYHIKRLLH